MENLQREQQKSALIAEITTAFDGVAREDGVTLHEAEALAYYRYGDYEIAQAKAQDTESRWQDVPIEHITKSRDVLPFLDAKGFRYYIPAFLIWFLTTEESGSHNHSLIQFILEGIVGDVGRKRSRLARLTLEQSSAIARFCAFAAEDVEIARAEAEKKLDHKVERGEMTQQEREDDREYERRIQIDWGEPDNIWREVFDSYWGRFL